MVTRRELLSLLALVIARRPIAATPRVIVLPPRVGGPCVFDARLTVISLRYVQPSLDDIEDDIIPIGTPVYGERVRGDLDLSRRTDDDAQEPWHDGRPRSEQGHEGGDQRTSQRGSS
jgi:hypothetical protein